MRLIDADEVLARIENPYQRAEIARWLRDAPTIERKTGNWKRAYLDHEAMGERPSVLYCSICNQCIAYPTNYCPNCGADMRGDDHEND